MQSILSKWYRIHSCDQESDTYIAVLSSQTSSVHLATASSVYHDAAITSDESIVEDEWVHFAYIHDENQGGKIFLNGIESGSNSTSGQICSATHVLLIGADSNLGSLWRFFDGKLDDLAIWNRALSPAEISIVYQGCSTLEFGVITGPISPITFTNSSYSISTPNPGSQYQWLVSNGILVSGQGTSQIEVLSSNTGIGTISVTETANDGCVPDSITLDVVVIPTSINDIPDSSILPYPDPAEDFVAQTIPSDLLGKDFLISDAQGAICQSGKLTQLNQIIRLHDLESGT